MFKALADPTRRQILYDLRKAEISAGELASHFPISGPSVSRHLAVLKSAGLVTERRQANKVFYTLAFERLAAPVGHFLSAREPGATGAQPSREKEKQTRRKGGDQKEEEGHRAQRWRRSTRGFGHHSCCQPHTCSRRTQRQGLRIGHSTPLT